MTRCRLTMTTADTVERLGEAIETGVMTINTRSRRTTKGGQILRGGNQIRVRGRMTGRTRVAVNLLHYIARVTGRTRCICSDRRISQPTRRVRCMVVGVVGKVLIRMTIQTMNGIGTRIGTLGYCINNLLSWAFVTG